MKNEKIVLGHGSGGSLTRDLIKNIFVKYFSNEILDTQTDSALIKTKGTNLAFTTDSYVVDPIFFPGGNIGKLAVCGTVNDLAVSGAIPRYLSASFIIEEGFSMDKLEKIVIAMADEARIAGIQIITGDTKVVNRGKCDQVFINTTGIGEFSDEWLIPVSSGKGLLPGDKIIINGNIGDHGIAVMAARESLHFESDVLSDCASLNNLIASAVKSSANIRFMRDATRGGLAAVLNEIARDRNLGISINEDSIPVQESVRGACEVFGFDPVYVANEGKIVMIVANNDALKVLASIKKHPLGRDATIIGEVTTSYPGKVIMQTSIGGSRIVDMPAGEQLPRIC